MTSKSYAEGVCLKPNTRPLEIKYANVKEKI
jgi:hypothetical protein